MDVGPFVIQSVWMYALAIVIAGLAALMIRAIVVLLERRQAGRKKAPQPAPARPVPTGQSDIPAADVAAITAAIYAALGVHRIVRIEPDPRNMRWSAQGRWLHHTSHDVHHTHHH